MIRAIADLTSITVCAALDVFSAGGTVLLDVMEGERPRLLVQKEAERIARRRRRRRQQRKPR